MFLIVGSQHFKKREVGEGRVLSSDRVEDAMRRDDKDCDGSGGIQLYPPEKTPGSKNTHRCCQ